MTKRLMATCGLLLAFGVVALANDFDKRTVITLNQPVIVAGVKTVTLQPGVYVMKLLNQTGNRNIVEIFNEREDRLLALVVAIPNYKLVPSDKTDLRFWETPEGNPVALKAWFFPGDTWGEELVYPKGLAAKIARQTGEPVLAAPPVETEVELAQAPVTQINKAGEEQPFEFDQNTLDEINGAPSAEPLLVAEAPAPAAPAAPEAPESLPATASPYFLLAAAGLLSVIAGLGLQRV